MRKSVFATLLISIMTLTACTDDKKDRSNPLLEAWDTPYGVPPFEQVKPHHYKPALEEAMREHAAQIDSIVSNSEAPSFGNVILALDNSGELYSRISAVFSLVGAADSNDALRAVKEQMSEPMAAHADNIYMNEALFAKVSAVYDARMSSELDALQIRLTEKTYERFRRAGVHLAEEDRQTLRKINGQLASQQVRFANNLLDANDKVVVVADSIMVGNVPHTQTTAASKLAGEREMSGKYVFRTDKTTLIPVLTYGSDRGLREKIYKAYLDRCNEGSEQDNRPTVENIVGLRAEKARLLGYDSHADYVLRERMAGSTEDVYGLLDEIWEPALAKATQELERMQTIKRRERGDDGFESWDWWYYAEKVRKADYSLDEELVNVYFSLDNVRMGVFSVCNRLYGLTFSPVHVPLYNKDCESFAVYDLDNSFLGIIILDYFPRPGKEGGAWCGSFRTRTYSGGERTEPVVNMVFNFTRPAQGRQSLLSLDMVRTFFHEFGHALHTLFTDVPYKGLQRVERDFVELPSQIMENWAFRPEILRQYALHYSSGLPIPEHMILAIERSAHFNQGFMTTELVAAAYLDMDIHSGGEAPADLNGYEREALYDKRGLIPQIEPRYRYPYFAHIFNGGYSAGYYSYLWAEVLDKDAFEAFVESGDVLDNVVARSFRENILSKGGSEDGMTLYRNFRGKDPSRTPLLVARGLIDAPVEEAEEATAPDTESFDIELPGMERERGNRRGFVGRERNKE